MRSQIEVLSRQRQALVSSLERFVSSKPRAVSVAERPSENLKQDASNLPDGFESKGQHCAEIGVSADGSFPRSELNGPSSQGVCSDDVIATDSCVRCVDWSQSVPSGFRRKLVRSFAPSGSHLSATPSHSFHRVSYGLSESKKRRRAAENSVLTRFRINLMVPYLFQ